MAQHSYTVTGNLVADPHYRQTGENQGVCKFRLGASRQRRGEDNVWYSVDQVWLNVECWGPLAQHARRSLTKGMAVIVVGTLVTHSWRDADGELQSYMVVKASHIGPDLNRYLTNTVVPQHAVVQADATAEMPDASTDVSQWVDSSSYKPEDVDKELAAVGAAGPGRESRGRQRRASVGAAGEVEEAPF